ncbi:MAG: hypothetical protein GY820_19490, partial [Gammaproteobacteria bacterium]|nr:hypothetical protein [Gammaproteobacteria bacterium]
MMQKSSARRTMQFEPLTNSIGAAGILAEIRQIPLPSNFRGHADHVEEIANGRAAKNATNGSFL